MLPNLVVFGLLALGLIAALALFVSLKYEVRLQARKDRVRIEAALQRLQDAAEHSARSPEAARLPDDAAEPAPPEFIPLRSGLNMSKRVQAVRLLRRGEDIGHVAAALGVTRGEIELLMRVQRLSTQRAAAANAAGGGN
jgi:hypothetical protein